MSARVWVLMRAGCVLGCAPDSDDGQAPYAAAKQAEELHADAIRPHRDAIRNAIDNMTEMPSNFTLERVPLAVVDEATIIALYNVAHEKNFIVRDTLIPATRELKHHAMAAILDAARRAPGEG